MTVRSDLILQDLKVALRSLWRSKGLSITVILTLALGIGANTAIFSFVDAVLLKPLPYPHPEELVMVWEKPPQGERNGISTLNFLDWKNQNTVFTAMAAQTREQGRYLGGRPPYGVLTCPRSESAATYIPALIGELVLGGAR